MKYIVVMEAPVTNAEGLHEICTMDFPSKLEPNKWDIIELAKYQLAFKNHIPKQHTLIGPIRIKNFRFSRTYQVKNKELSL